MSNCKTDSTVEGDPFPPNPEHPKIKEASLASKTDRPTYAAAFRCIGASCEDTCCRDWAIPLDKERYKQYQKFPPEKLGSVVSQYVSINATAGAPESIFARILPTSSGCCPFFGVDRLCAVHKEYGADLLSSTCSIYPRAFNVVEGVLEGSLAMSCPEAARNVLLVPDSTQVTGDLFSGEFRTDTVLRLATRGGSSIHKPYDYFHAIRSLLIEMVKDRSRPLWQRLLFIGSLCKSLDEVNTAQEDERVPAILEDHRQALEQDTLRSSLESIPAQPRLKLSVILKLTDARVQDKESGTRFRDTFWTFVEGIGAGLDATAKDDKDDLQRYLEAEQRYHRPFFARSPFILENYLLNYIFQKLFPFGIEENPRFRPRRIFEEYVLLATQFAWIDALLIGVAGHHKEAFAEEHVVQVIQSFCRAVEHNRYVLISINEFMANLQLDTLQGMAVMLKN
jgi:lysine-N-methylase